MKETNTFDYFTANNISDLNNKRRMVKEILKKVSFKTTEVEIWRK